MSTTSLVYSGNVTIKVGKNTFNNHNAGHNRLFELFAYWLCKQTIPQKALPQYVDIYTLDPGGTGRLVSMLYNKIPVNMSVRSDNSDNYYAVVDCVVSFTHIKSDMQEKVKTDNNREFILQLVNDENPSNSLASIQIENAVLQQVLTGRQAVIEWALSISNRNEGE